MGNFNSEVGERIFTLRKERGFTREKLAELADISVQFLADIEKGRKSMTINTLRKIAPALMTTSDYIIYGSSSNADSDAVTAIYNSLSQENKEKARKILAVIAE